MYPVLFELGGLEIYSYGFMIAVGALAGVGYMVIQGKKEVGLSFDQANALFLLIFLAAFVGGKVFLFFEDVPYYLERSRDLYTGRGFVFYGSFLLAIPTMFLFFRHQKIPSYTMLDVMAVTTCLVHMFGRIGCFLAGCCYGKPTDSIFGVVYSDAVCQARPLGESLHPTQLYEAGYIFLVMLVLLWLRQRKKFNGQLFLTYLMLYATGRFMLEYLRGDLARGFVIQDISHSQLIAVAILVVTIFVYVKWSKQNRIVLG